MVQTNNIWNTVSRWVWSRRERQQWRTSDRNKSCSSTKTQMEQEEGRQNKIYRINKEQWWNSNRTFYGKIGSCKGFEKARVCGQVKKQRKVESYFKCQLRIWAKWDKVCLSELQVRVWAYDCFVSKAFNKHKPEESPNTLKHLF